MQRKSRTNRSGRVYMTKDGKRPLTPRVAVQRFDAAMKAAREGYVKIANSARDIETLLAAPKGKATVAYAIRAMLVELSNESHVGVDMPGIAGAFYRAAVLELHDSRNIHVQQTLRHLDILLSNPDFKTASTLIKYWDDPRSKDLRKDPFPAKPDPFTLAKNRPRTSR